MFDKIREGKILMNGIKLTAIDFKVHTALRKPCVTAFRAGLALRFY